ncbi:MAG: recombination protein RecR, partial [Planctomycetes bacterium]|nr:recombination protein RecR [Planctomycetota bacterium]
MGRRRESETPHPFGPAVSRLIDEFAKLPGIGRKSAERLTHHMLSRSEKESLEFADAIRAVKSAVRPCTQCFNLTEGEICGICADTQRDETVLCVVEQARDITSLEASGVFRGKYHVLQGRLAPLDGIG